MATGFDRFVGRWILLFNSLHLSINHNDLLYACKGASPPYDHNLDSKKDRKKNLPGNTIGPSWMPRSAASAADFVHLFWLVGQLAYVIGFSARLCHNLWLPLIGFVSRFTLQMPQIVRHPFNVGTPTSVRACQKLEVSGFMCIFSFSFRRHMHARGTGLRCRPRQNDTTKDNA